MLASKGELSACFSQIIVPVFICLVLLVGSNACRHRVLFSAFVQNGGTHVEAVSVLIQLFPILGNPVIT